MTAPAWVERSRARFAGTLLAGDGGRYPCYFGVEGERKGWNTYTWVEGRADLGRLAGELAGFLAESRRRPAERRSLVCLIGPPRDGAGERSLVADRAEFWRLLEALHELDVVPWPPGVPTDPAEPRWKFCFAGEPIFVFGLSPAYRDRRSRAVGDCLAVVFQSELVFAGMGGATPAGRAAKRRVRTLLGEYDTIGPHPALGDAARPSVHKWRQYFLPDDQSVPERCPFG
ncbi:MAG TPA: YqcI/YcgG family protein [Candidatus Dormibacteraeota bacterium]|nr:YqcI/YcgG family protein [Candidatus Dormibacteraeota bacterium]